MSKTRDDWAFILRNREAELKLLQTDFKKFELEGVLNKRYIAAVKIRKAELVGMIKKLEKKVR